MRCLIEELYSSKAISLIRDLYKEDEDSRSSFFNAFGHKIIQSQDKILLSNPLDILLFICSTVKFTTSEEECQQAAVIVFKRINDVDPLPYLLDLRNMQDITLAEKTFVSLSFFYPALLKRWKRGAPHPSFYRNCAKQIFISNGYENLALNIEKWELFFQEFFI